jgi:hypothetical protein
VRANVTALLTIAGVACIPTSAAYLPIFAAGQVANAHGQGATPLGEWMTKNMRNHDHETLQRNFNIIEGMPPPSRDYPQWGSIAKSGSDAAAKAEATGVDAACKKCHDLYAEKYRKEYPLRPFP